MGSSVVDVNGVPAFDETYPAWQGIAPIKDAISFVLLDEAVTQDYIRIDFNSPGNPAGYVECCRLLIGTRVTHDGFNYDRETQVDDTSSINDEFGSLTVENYTVRQQLKFVISGVKDEAYYDKWLRFNLSVGTSKFFLLLEQVGTQYEQIKACYVRNLANPKAVERGPNNHEIEYNCVTYK